MSRVVKIIKPTNVPKAYPVVSFNDAIQARYEKMRRDGQSHSMAEMLAFQKPPGSINTDRTFMEAEMNNQQLDSMGKVRRENLLKKAKAAGVSISGKVYKTSLARYPGDPRAWVSDLSDVKRVVEERNIDCEGHVSHKAYETAPRESQGLSDSAMRRLLNDAIEADPIAGTTAAGVERLQHEIVDRHVPEWKKSKGHKEVERRMYNGKMRAKFGKKKR